MKPIIIRKPFEKVKPVSITFDAKEGKTKQSFKDECDINFILKKYRQSGQLPYLRENGVYADHTATDLFESMQIVASAKTMFEELPSNIRNKFENDPVQFLEFTENPENMEEMVNLGLAERNPDYIPPPTEPEAVASPPQEPVASPPQEPVE